MPSPLLLCDMNDVAAYWSELGMVARADDSGDDLLTPDEAEHVLWAIEVASHEVAERLCQRYRSPGFIGGNPPASTARSVRLMVATVAAYHLSTRRGNPVPESLVALMENVHRRIDDILAKRAILVDAVVPAEAAPFVSNVRVDSTYTLTKLRRVPSTSTGNRGQGVKEHIDTSFDGRVP